MTAHSARDLDDFSAEIASLAQHVQNGVNYPAVVCRQIEAFRQRANALGYPSIADELGAAKTSGDPDDFRAIAAHLSRFADEIAQRAAREVVQVGLDGRSQPMLRYADELGRPDHARSIVSPEDRARTFGVAELEAEGARLVGVWETHRAQMLREEHDPDGKRQRGNGFQVGYAEGMISGLAFALEKLGYTAAASALEGAVNGD